MKNMSATDIVLILTCIFSGICSVIAAFKANKASKDSTETQGKLDDAHDKLEVVRKQTNGNLAEQKAKLEQREAEISRLQRIVQELANAAPPGSLAEIKTREGEHRIDDKA